MLIKAEQSFLLVVDVQEKLAPVVLAPEAAIAAVVTLVKAARRLGVPCLASEQYPKGLGPTVPAVASVPPADSAPAKVHFSRFGEPRRPGPAQARGRRQGIG